MSDDSDYQRMARLIMNSGKKPQTEPLTSNSCAECSRLQRWLADSRHKNANLRDAANAVLAHFMPSFPDSRAVDDCLVGLAAAVADIESHSHETREHWCGDPACSPVTEIYPCTHLGCKEPDGSKCRHWPRGSEKAKVQRCVCGEAVIPDGELRVEVGTTTHRLAGPCFQTPPESEGA